MVRATMFHPGPFVFACLLAGATGDERRTQHILIKDEVIVEIGSSRWSHRRR